MRDYENTAKALRCCRLTSERGCAECPFGLNNNEKCANLLPDAADAIEELLAAVPHWISVEERLPETGKVVLLCINCEKSRPHTGFLAVDGVFMHDVLGDMSRSQWKVSHWMPLPEPPKGVE